MVLFMAIFILLPIIIVLVVGVILKDKKMIQGCITAFCALFFLSLLVFLVELEIMPIYLGSHGMWLPYTIIGSLFAACMVLVWGTYKKKICRIIMCVFVACAVLPIFFASAHQAYQNSFLVIKEVDSDHLFDYEPFTENTLAKSLNETSTLKFTGDLPRLDGATALYPLYSSFARATYPEADYSFHKAPLSVFVGANAGATSTEVICSQTNTAFKYLIDGHVDVIFLMGVSDSQRAMVEERGLKLNLTPIGRDAFVFFVNQRNAATDISTEDIRGIYSGQITNWKEISGRNDKIRAYQRPENSGSQTMLQEIMGDVPLVDQPEEYILGEMQDMHKAVSSYRNYKNSIGYSFRYYLKDMLNGDEVKLLSINGVDANADTIASGEYPYVNDFYAITVDREPESEEDKRRMENTELLIEWILSAQGQYLVEATGYVPIQ